MAKSEEKEVKEVKESAAKPSEEEKLRELIGGARDEKKAAMAEEAVASETATKAERFQSFIKENDISYFDEPQALDDQFHTTIFRSRIEAKGQVMPMAIFIDDSFFTIIRTQIATGINEKNVARIKDYLNTLNAEYKMFKYYLREDGTIFLDVCIPFADETFDPIMIHTLLPILVKQLETVYEDLMAEVWAKD